MEHFIKNIDFSKSVELKSLVQYQQGQVVSRTLAQGKPVNITLFAFDKGEEKHVVKDGETIVMPANVSHALFAKEKFKMLLTVVFTLG